MLNKETNQKYCVACSEIYGEIVGKMPDESEAAALNSATPAQQVMSLGAVSSFRVAEEALCGQMEWAARTLAGSDSASLDQRERLVIYTKNVAEALQAVQKVACCTSSK